jgi:hypothetical protein
LIEAVETGQRQLLGMPCQVILAEAFVFAQFFQTQWIKQYFPVINKQLGHKAPDSNVAR